MDKAQDNVIRVGDLVAVVHNTKCCNSPTGVGLVYKVTDIIPPKFDILCTVCKHVYSKQDVGFLALGGVGIGFPLWALQKLRPPSQEATRYTQLINKVRDPLMIKNLL